MSQGRETLNNLNVAYDLITGIQKGETTVEKFVSKLDINHIDANVITSAIEGSMIQSKGMFGRNSYVEAFNKARKNALKVSTEGYKEIIVLSEAEKEVFKAETEKFTQTSNDTGAGLTQISSLVATSLLPVMQKYFYETPILQLVTTSEGTDKLEVRDITNNRAAEAIAETTAPTPADDTVVIDTLDPRKVRLIDSKTITWLLQEIGDPTTSGDMIGRMEFAIRKQIEALVIGATGSDTDGANQFYSILNSKASSGTNRGSLAVTLTGVGIVNEIDAINYLLGQLPLDGDQSVATQSVVTNWATKVNVLRSKDANNLYIGEKALFNQSGITTISSMANNVVLAGDFSNVVLRLLRAPKLTTRIVDDNTIRLIYDTYGDGTIRFAYKATATKNGFRHGTLETDGNWAS